MINDIGYTVDLLIFGIDSKKNDNVRELSVKKLNVLLVNREKEPFINKWCLPGGFVNNDEVSVDAANRILKKETNLNDVYLEHFDIFDALNRDPRGRVVSNAFISLMDKDKIKENISNNSKWFDIEIVKDGEVSEILLKSETEQLSIKIRKTIKNITTNEYSYEIINNDLAFDHGLIIGKGIDVIKDKAKNTDIIFELMPDTFTIGELKQVYELLLDKKLINSAFRRVISNKIAATDTIIKNGGFRPSTLYKYNK